MLRQPPLDVKLHVATGCEFDDDAMLCRRIALHRVFQSSLDLVPQGWAGADRPHAVGGR